MKRIIDIVTLTVIVVSLTSCTRTDEKSSPSPASDGIVSSSPNERGMSKISLSGEFNQPDIPFTFTYPKEQFRDASISYRLAEPEKGPSYVFEMDEYNGINVEMASTKEYSTQENIDLLKSQKIESEFRIEKHGEQEMVFFEKDFEFNATPAVSGHSRSYFFGRDGKTWHLDFYSTLAKKSVVENVSKLVMESIKFKPSTVRGRM